MTDYNKKSLTQGAVLLLAAFVVFFTIILFHKAGWVWWAIPFPALGVGYGVYSFVKKYYPR